jgi:hypothetical protein
MRATSLLECRVLEFGGVCTSCSLQPLWQASDESPHPHRFLMLRRAGQVATGPHPTETGYVAAAATVVVAVMYVAVVVSVCGAGVLGDCGRSSTSYTPSAHGSQVSSASPQASTTELVLP